jgi:hypothetical protein
LFCIVDENDVVVWNEKKREREGEELLEFA